MCLVKADQWLGICWVAVVPLFLSSFWFKNLKCGWLFCLNICLCTTCVLMPSEIIRGHRTPWNRVTDDLQLLCWCVLGMEPRFCGGTARTVNHLSHLFSSVDLNFSCSLQERVFLCVLKYKILQVNINSIIRFLVCLDSCFDLVTFALFKSKPYLWKLK